MDSTLPIAFANFAQVIACNAAAHSNAMNVWLTMLLMQPPWLAKPANAKSITAGLAKLSTRLFAKIVFQDFS